MVTQAQRHVWMDHIRGLAIVLVVLTHSGMLLREGYVEPETIAHLNAALSPYRMPALAFLSGFLAHLSFRKALPVFLSGKVRNLLWPYLVWSVIAVFTINRGHSLLDYELYLSYLWYLVYLFIYYLISYFTQAVSRLPMIAAALSIAALIPGELQSPQRFFFLLAMFQLGEVAYSMGSAWTGLVGRRSVYLLLVPVAAASASAIAGREAQYDPRWFAASVAALLFLTVMVPRVQEWRALRPLAYIGRNSLVYYVVHFPVIYGCVHLLADMGVGSPYVAFGLSAVTAMAVGTVASALRDAPVLSLLFAFPARRAGGEAARKVGADRAAQLTN